MNKSHPTVEVAFFVSPTLPRCTLPNFEAYAKLLLRRYI